MQKTAIKQEVCLVLTVGTLENEAVSAIDAFGSFTESQISERLIGRSRPVGKDQTQGSSGYIFGVEIIYSDSEERFSEF